MRNVWRPTCRRSFLSRCFRVLSVPWWRAAPEAPLSEVRHAALIILYRLLFILYAEDRDLLPVRDERYRTYALRERVRRDVGARKDRGDVFSACSGIYWYAFDSLCQLIDRGDSSIGLPPYNGGLFDRTQTPLLARIQIPDQVMADVVDALSFEQSPAGRRYINYRDLGVQQLGSIYERLLEQDVVYESGEITVHPNIFARRVSGSYYTPGNLVDLVIKETVDPLIALRIADFETQAAELDRGLLKRYDPAERLLELKICDPAMGSGHFLVNLVDYLADQVIIAMAEAEARVAGYVSPLYERITRIRETIIRNAEEHQWTIDRQQLDDRYIVRRMVLKRCIYGVDKNAMAVELAKVSLWLHTFTAGAPLTFLDHHLRCGDSLFGMWVHTGIAHVMQHGVPLFLQEPLEHARRSIAKMQLIEDLTDIEIAEVHRSAAVFTDIKAMTDPLNAFLSLVHAFEWLDNGDKADKMVRSSWLDGTFGDPIQIASDADGAIAVSSAPFAALLEEARQLQSEERFFHWQVAFPGVWSDWEKHELQGGF